ncbi:MAG: thiamine pyrophosphate-dependent enzyme, partial [Bacillota bacterium]
LDDSASNQACNQGEKERTGLLVEGVLPPYGEINTDTVVRAVKAVAALVFAASGVDTGAANRPDARAISHLSHGASPCACGIHRSCDQALVPIPGSVSGDNGTRYGVSGNENRDAGEEVRTRLRSLVAPRSSTLCAGCPHLGSYWALREVLRSEKGVHIVNGDIGCYEQGGYGIFSRAIPGDEANSKRYRVSSPYEILDTIYVMGSGIGLAMGQAQAGYSDGKIVAVAGDSTFFHATLPAVVNAVYTGANITFLVFDNSWTCMTGHQPSPTTGISTTGRKARTVSIEDVAKSIGIESLTVVDAYDVAAAKAAIKEAVAFKGQSMVVLRRECALQVQRRERRKGTAVTHVEREACTGCRLCVELGCPAVTFDAAAKQAGVDEILCVDCGLCAQVCPRGAIKSAMDSGSDACGAGAGARR